jgi:hypothetical protein
MERRTKVKEKMVLYRRGMGGRPAGLPNEPGIVKEGLEV